MTYFSKTTRRIHVLLIVQETCLILLQAMAVKHVAINHDGSSENRKMGMRSVEEARTSPIMLELVDEK